MAYEIKEKEKGKEKKLSISISGHKMIINMALDQCKKEWTCVLVDKNKHNLICNIIFTGLNTDISIQNINIFYCNEI